MSLDERQLALVRAEFHRAFELTGETPHDAAAALGWPEDRVTRTRDLGPGADPVDVWLLRDRLHAAIRRSGRPSPFTVLTTARRLQARLWFSLPRAPRR